MSAKNRDKKESGGNFDFFSYEAGFAFAVGALLATVLSLYVWPVILIVSTLGVSWGLTHLIGQTLVKRRRERQQRRTEEDERERRALLARSAASLENEAQSRRRRRKRSV